MADDLCWTSLVGAPTHNLGDLPEKCFTCEAKRREDRAKMAPRGPDTCGGCGEVHLSGEDCVRDVEVRIWLEHGLACPNPTERARMTAVLRDTKSTVGQD